jgi:hypothetical protein
MSDHSSVCIANVNSEWGDSFVSLVFLIGVQSDKLYSSKL